MQQIDRLERADHDLEMGDAVGGVEADDVDAVELDTFDFVLELQHSTRVVSPFADVTEAGAA